MKKLEQGITNFKKFIDEDCYFVDKTHLIGYLIDHPSEVHLITRPRRFGKTLNLSMIRCFLEAPLPTRQQQDSHTSFTTPNAYLFEDLAIASHPRCAEFMGQYPVIHLSFKNVKSARKEESMDLVKSVIADEFERHNYLLEREFFDESKIQYYTEIQNRNACGR